MTRIMKQVRNKSIFFLLTLFSFAFVSQAQQAHLQLIHNSPDVSFDTVDVYVNGTKELDNLGFREATAQSWLPQGAVPQGVQQLPPVPAATNVDLGIAPKNSSGPGDVVKTFTRAFPADTHAVIVNGVANPGNYASNPDNKSTALSLDLIQDVNQLEAGSGNVDLGVYHGATDAPFVDLVPFGTENPIVDNAAYGDFSGYLDVPVTDDLILDVTDSANNTVVRSAFAPSQNLLTPLEGQGIIAFASGFLNPENNQDGERLGIMVALVDGITLNISIDISFHQIIHNAPDPSLNEVDVYVDGNLALDDFKFREATQYVTLPIASEEGNIGIAPSNSSSVDDTLVNFQRRAVGARSYAHTAAGVVEPDSFADNPDGNSIGVNLNSEISSRFNPANNQGNILFQFGSFIPDMPTIDMLFDPAVVGGQVNNIDDFEYPATTGFFPQNTPADYTIHFVDSSSTPIDTVYQFERDLSNFADSVIQVKASGFFKPDSTNQDGPEAQLIGYFPNGDTVMFDKTLDHNNVDTGDGSDDDDDGGDGSSVDQAARADFGASVFPNPASDNTTVAYELNQQKAITFKLYDNSGKAVKQKDLGSQAAGQYTENINVEELEAGLYHLKIQAGDQAQDVKLLVD